MSDTVPRFVICHFAFEMRMPHPLIQEIRTVARRAKRLLVVYGAAAVSVTLLISALAASVVDYAFRIHDPGVRLMLSIAVLLAAADDPPVGHSLLLVRLPHPTFNPNRLSASPLTAERAIVSSTDPRLSIGR